MNFEENKKNEFKELSHDIQNILSTIVNNSKLLKQKIGDDSSVTKLISVIENNSLRASEIIREFLSGRKTQNRKIDSSILFEDIVSSFENYLPSNVQFKALSDNTHTAVYGNYSDLYRALFNLLVNAKEAISSSGEIFFQKELENDKNLVLRIKDSGCGIENSKIEELFKTGYSTKQKGRESGFGLSIVKNIIADHKGSINVKSEVGVGTEFKVSIPVFIEKENVPSNKKLLIADDDNSLRESLADLFESYGYKPFQARNGKEVLDFISRSNDTDLLLIDKKMPIIDGISCIEEIRKNNKLLPIILVTGVNLDLDELEKLETINGVSKIILKPYDFVYLKEVVDLLLS